jgi:hypothetical protein
MCSKTLDEGEFTPFSRNPELNDRNGRVVVCKSCCSKYVEEHGNTKEALKNMLRIISIPYLESYANMALELYERKKDGTNLVIRKNVYTEEESESLESVRIQNTIFTCYTSKIGLIPKRYINFSFSDGVRSDEVVEEEKISPNVDKKALTTARTFISKRFNEAIRKDKDKLAKAVKLAFDEISLHKNNVNKRQEKFKLKNSLLVLIENGDLDKKDYEYLYTDKDNDTKEVIEVEVEQEDEVIEEDSSPVVKLPKNIDINALAEKWGYGYTPEQLYAFEKKYQLLKNNYPEKTALHTEALLTYIRYRVNEEVATAKGDVKAAKDWGELASKQATNAKINVSQLSKNDLQDGLDSFGSLVKAVETAVDIIPILPQFKEQPQDKVDFTLYCYINYVRDLKGLPPAEYKDIYAFYDERKKEYDKKYSDNTSEESSEELGDDNEFV